MSLPGVAQLLQNAPTAIGATMVQRSPGGRSETPSYGLTMWFRVEVADVDGVRDLGRWSGCSGLGVTFHTEPIKSGGDYNGARHAPTEITYPNLKLKRAMDRAGSRSVRDWLQQVADRWMNGAEAGQDYHGATITVTLLSSLTAGPMARDNEVAQWVFSEAVPVEWTGPALDSKTGTIAVEELSIAHRGFLLSERARSNRAVARGGQGKLTLILLEGEGSGEKEVDQVDFLYNPAKVALEKTAKVKQGNAVFEKAEDRLTDPGKLKLTIGELRVEGRKAVADTIEKLWDWLDPDEQGTPSAGAKGKEPNKVTTRRVFVRLGGTGKSEGINHKAVLKIVKVSYTRFTATGVPIRAAVDLTLEEAQENLPHTNPHSGGLPGGHTHTVSDGENLVGITTAALGSPAQWRDVAEANGIDDPLRVRNGRALRLPGR